jgi:hypothetical protein
VVHSFLCGRFRPRLTPGVTRGWKLASSGRCCWRIASSSSKRLGPSLLLTHIVFLTFHIMRTERDGRSRRKAGEHRRAFPGVGARLGGGGARIGSPTSAASERQARRYVEQARESGSREVPKPKLVLTVKLPVDLVRRLRRYAKTDQRMVSSIVAQSLEELSARMPSVLHRIDESKSTSSSTGWARITWSWRELNRHEAMGGWNTTRPL